MPRITPSLWFDQEAEEAMNFYVGIFNGAPGRGQESKIVGITRYEKGLQAPGADQMLGKVINGVFELDGQTFTCLDGGPLFRFNESVSLQVECEDQTEVDYFWNKLSAVPESEQCGWIKDKFGLSWQIVPKRMFELLGDPDRNKALSAANAMLQMKKIDVDGLEKAFNTV